jgi:hypothetical protein
MTDHDHSHQVSTMLRDINCQRCPRKRQVDQSDQNPDTNVIFAPPGEPSEGRAAGQTMVTASLVTWPSTMR